MKSKYDEFLDSLRSSGLLSPEELESLLEGMIHSQQGESDIDSRQLAHQLVQAGKLAPYQASALYQGKLGHLFLGNYDILSRIGEGGMGQVFKARHRLMRRVVAIKILPRKMLSNANAVKRFRREIRAAAQLVHPNIVTALDADEANKIHFLVMEYVDGNDLARFVKERGPLSIRDAIDCIVQAARGLEHAHANGIIHRDIKPSNLLLDTSGTVKVLDMGLARVAGEMTEDSIGPSTLTDTGTVVGTADFMAPEQAQDSKRIDARVDIYSLGFTLFYLLTGKKAYAGDSVIQVLLAHQQQPIPSLCEVRPDVPRRLEAIFHKMAAKDPAQRFPSMGAVIDALQLLDTEPTSDDAPALFVESAEKRSVGNFDKFLETLETEATSTLILPEQEASSSGRSTTATYSGSRSREAGIGAWGSWKKRSWTSGAVAALVLLIAIVFWVLRNGNATAPSDSTEARVETNSVEPASRSDGLGSRKTLPSRQRSSPHSSFL